MPENATCFIGIDLGTQGARAVLADLNGRVLASSKVSFPLNAAFREEQPPATWRNACFSTLRELIAEAKGKIRLSAIKALSVTSTSGTVIPLDDDNRPLHNALMYSDKRSAGEAALCSRIAAEHHPDGFTAFNSSCGLAKMVWFAGSFPEKARRIRRWAHAADYITALLSDRWGLSDHTSVLKSGYDLERGSWPDYIFRQLPLRREWLPEAVAPGTPICHISGAVAAELGLPANLQVVAGMTDGCASQVASGAMAPGMWNTTIGTTMVIKGVTRQPLKDPQGRFYNHRHPDGYWMPGGASNTGADWVREFGDQDELLSLERAAAEMFPSGIIAYPLRQEGERFPFIAPQARGFGPEAVEFAPGSHKRPGSHKHGSAKAGRQPEGLSAAALLVANMEGVAYLERYAFELAEQLSGEKVNAVYSAGGGSASETWLNIRSNVLNKPVYLTGNAGGAMGAAILAASRTHFTSLAAAARAMTRVQKEIFPRPQLTDTYQKHYLRFIQTLIEKGYIHHHNNA